MAVDQKFYQYIEDQLTIVDGVTSKKMFGGVGFFKEGKMFGMISTDTSFRLKVDESNKADFEKHNMKPLFMKNKKKGMPYWEVPAHILEDQSQLKVWVERSIAIALK